MDRLYEAILNESDSYLTSGINYNGQNPVKHTFTKDLRDWTYSSYWSHLSEKSSLLARKEVISWFGGAKEYANFHTSNNVGLFEEWELFN
ncbi:hypothetical protein [Cyclobacterium amurskyense]|uniref:hypothetical protein n=1 Tax=Cyclobacterium amurskyense TaxID=320787 RepID=UPI0030DD8881